jgi:hypothetical protein
MYFFDRAASGSNNSMVIKDGERAVLYSRHDLTSDYAGWPAKLKEVFTRSALTATKSSLRGLVREEGSEYRYWFGNDGDGNDETCAFGEYGDGFVNANKFTVSSSNRCINSLSVTDQWVVTNNSDSEKTIVTNANSQVLKLGKKNISTVAGSSRSFSARIEVSDSETVTTVVGEQYIGANFSLCLNEDLVLEGDELDLEGTWSTGGTPLAPDEFTVNDGDATYIVPADNPYDQVIYVDLVLVADAAGVHSATADVKKNGSSVVEECPDFDALPDWPDTIEKIDGPASAPQATITSRVMPTAKFTGDNWDRYGVFADGFGGVFHYGTTNDEGRGTVTLVQLEATGPANGYNQSGKRDIASNSFGYFDFGRYGANGANQFTLVERSRGNWEYTTATMSGASPQTATLTKKTIARLCERGYTFGFISAISAPTTDPTVLVWCAKGNSYRQSIVSIANNRPVVKTRLGTPTRTHPCVKTGLGVNSSATGSAEALIVYTATTSRDADGGCTVDGATVVSSRSIVSVNVQGTASTTTLSSSPWGESGEPSFMQIVPGLSAGQWVGMTLAQEFWSFTPANLFNMTAGAISVGEPLTLDTTTSFGDSPWYDIVSQESDSEWLISIDGSSMFEDGEAISRATVASVNVSTGQITNGDVVQLTGFGTHSVRTTSVFSGNGPIDTTYFSMTGVNAYSTTTWDLP